jgi:transcriptional regulator with XRE-family HTH domain
MGHGNGNKAREVHSAILAEAEKLRSPVETTRTRARMMLAAKIYDAIQQKGISKKQFAEMLGQQPSVITKWLSGTHNFTADTLADIQRVLEISLFNFDEQPKQEKIAIAFDLVRKPATAEEYEIANLSIS